MGATLDRSRPYGSVHGDNTNGVVYEQDHKQFDGMGKEVVRFSSEPTGDSANAPKTPYPGAKVGPTVTKDGQGNLFRDGDMLDIEDMDAAAMRGLAKDMGMTLHPQTGKAKALAAIMDNAGPHDQLAAQLDN